MGAQGTHKTSFVFAAPVTETHQMSCSSRREQESLMNADFLLLLILKMYMLQSKDKGPLSIASKQ